MASSDYDTASAGMDADWRSTERTYRGFLLTLKLSGAVTVRDAHSHVFFPRPLILLPD